MSVTRTTQRIEGAVSIEQIVAIASHEDISARVIEQRIVPRTAVQPVVEKRPVDGIITRAPRYGDTEGILRRQRGRTALIEQSIQVTDGDVVVATFPRYEQSRIIVPGHRVEDVVQGSQVRDR